MSVVAGSLIDHYRIERPVGSGAFATVYLANDDRLDDVVAVKILAENRALDIDARRRFIEEAQKLRAVRSPSIVTVFDVGETATNQPYMVLEYADRGDLAARRGGLNRPVSAVELGAVIDFLADALSALHRNGLVHRDVKPHNVLLASRSATGEPGAVQPPPGALIAADERPLLGDLGFVKDLEAASGYTVGGGTMSFRAPEQAAALSTVDHRADIFAASALVLWLITGVAPPDSSGWEHLLTDSTGPVIPLPVTVALAAGLSVDPNARQPTIEAWRAELVAALTPKEVPVPTRTRSRLWPFVAVLLVVAALAAGGWWVAGRDQAATAVADGVARTEQRIGASTVAIVGPDEVNVGEPVVFRVEVNGDATARWIEPDGSAVDPSAERTFLPRSEGRFRVSVLVAAPGESPTVVVHHASAAPS